MERRASAVFLQRRLAVHLEKRARRTDSAMGLLGCGWLRKVGGCVKMRRRKSSQRSFNLLYFGIMEKSFWLNGRKARTRQRLMRLVFSSVCLGVIMLAHAGGACAQPARRQASAEKSISIMSTSGSKSGPNSSPGSTMSRSSAKVELDASLNATDRRFIKQLLSDAKSLPSLGARMAAISARLLGRPYLTHSLIGSPTEPEQFVARMDGFDCVTFLETVLALARAHDLESYLQTLRLIRYDEGVISYATRLHYTTEWNRANIQRGFLQDLSQRAGSVERTKTLSLLPGFAPRASTFRYYPKTQLNAVSRWLQDGDLIYFVSAANGLDTYHVGILFRSGDQWMMRHAAKSRGQVVEQPIAEFCQQNRMSGFILARPVDAQLSRR